ncbi:hypothetical protein EDB87DRAFT_1635758 [Lactarius vividus]|nr:hypothetical protein EDB87DRAFT_1635758 [Lactarius vividus]
MWNAIIRETEAGPSIGDIDSVESAAFSPDGNTETIRHVAIHDHTVISEEGWICGSKGELLMWILEIHRAYLHRLGVIWITGARETRIDLSTFVHGRNWTTCINT